MTSLLAIDPAAIVHALPFPALLIGPDGMLAAINATGSTTFGIEVDAVGSPAHQLRVMRRVPGLGDSIAVAQRGGRSVPLLVRAVNTAGRRQVRLIVTPIGSPPGGRAAVLVIGEDVVTGGDAGTSGKPESRFLATLAHELRNPLGALVNALHILGQRVSGDRVAGRAWALANRQARYQARLLEDLLDTSRLDVGKLELRAQRVDLADVLRETVESARLTAQASAQELTLTLEAGTIVVRGDRTRLEQIVRNLLDNALKYTGPGGHIEVTAGSDGVTAVLRVKDSGIGMDGATLGLIFETFAQADSSVTASKGGLGMGLGLVRALVQLHGGTVEARSAGLGRGSEFEVRLPIDSAPSPARPAAPVVPPARARHILLIEDDRDAREVLQLVLELDGHRVETAADGATGVRIAAATAPDTVVIDIGMPVMDGYETARRIRKRLGSAVRLIALTGYGDPEARQQAHDAGFDAHVVKPVMPEDLGRLLAG